MTDTTTDAAPSLWRHRAFLTLWSGQSASAIGTQLAGLAIPTLAVTVLAATEFQVGLLGALETAAFLIIGLPAGAWIDRWRKRRVMLGADLVRALALATIPLAWFAGALTMTHVLVVAAVIGCATVFFDVAYQSYLPVLVPPATIGDANGKLEATQQLARVVGPAASGALLAIVRPAVVIAIDAVSYLLSFVALALIRDDERPTPREHRRPLPVEIREGAAFVIGEPLLRRIVACTATSNLFSTIATALLPIVVLREIGLSTALWGVAISLGAIGGLLGATLSARIARVLGEGHVIPVSAIVFGVALLPLGLLPWLTAPLAFVVLAVAEFAISFSVLVYNIAQVTFRQRICPPALLGRMNASIRFVVWGVMPIGGLLAGVLGATLGAHAALWIGAVGTLLPAVFVVFSPLWRMRDLPRISTTPRAQDPQAQD
ncbi:MFS transporter [Galbitalea sp. SE-J8]|uniref:MFS transporter n=1 Tax=Galbitalea sp. SE-J8 TaxID=3054952 RepID=UPI00259C9933|nr:MFS transporter [Galbitalea sp. SE-J8]MDM4762640.1 MFS transporter [Galbitalea sp. SE-J8]